MKYDTAVNFETSAKYQISSNRFDLIQNITKETFHANMKKQGSIEDIFFMQALHQKHERELWKDKIICLLGTKALAGLNVELKHCWLIFVNQYQFAKINPHKINNRENY